ncbi:acyl-CoA thioesterase [Pseudomonas chlororaphis]|uniref:Acyl-CoA thioesterase II n=1 Tax=Pseudomonas chlororaphis TaxID=587753 RepID=A0AAX3FT45_9PSED|nr:thioesterase family protein [Pseudomonas chlororaphis]AZC38990.1 TesB-like acyl-CoA thioesterase 1 [Pseudomonas chlororaphis subsp. piscium]AZC45540.1 TesB-like acyl-CoA thioesterase 1 [Pseudomonas chlororaphis subsp. piscium]AZC52192.1 TesB-like acyl-CoA thioesterase 1 [Pseudomonas chlororaphis subsp. piscium]AZC58648.1 TesB-like acyl-CoA thioesterase 1 [Pseudomonas chlororaphis subsp. piscium]AZC64860.1 TesB-like acyl-CoA thioesterase 1 [Pseudomonas chlororaphis subsp. piscium]
MRFSDLLDAVRQHPLELSIPTEWAQGRASFGGLVAALQYEAMRAKVPAERPVRSLAITFVGPVTPDAPVSFEVEVLREGKAVSQVLGRALQNGQVVTLVQGSFGASRPSEVTVVSEEAPAMKHWDECPELPYVKGVTPEFMRHLAMRWSIGGMPFTGNKSRDMGGWVRLRGDVKVEPMTEAHILALVDAWPPALLPHLTSPVPGSTLTWTIEFVQPLLALSTLDWCKYRVSIEHARDGYGHASAALWSAEDQLIALSRQTVTIFG